MSYYTDTIRSLKSAGFVEHAKDYQYLRSRYYQRGTQIKKLERELNEARECLREIVSQLTLVDARASGETWQLATCDGDEVHRWRKAARLTNIETDENAPIVNRESEQ
jgi:DNA-binding MarR family transcriptional regulator